MHYVLEEIFAIGIGPSSSHTVGPMKAAKRFVDNLIADNLLEKVHSLKVDLYGSLALTGIGHGTLKAIVYGLMGFVAEDVDTEKPYYDSVKRDNILHLAQQKPIPFCLDTDMILNKDVFLKEHSNGMKFTVWDENKKELLSETYFSIGGGTILRQDEFGCSLTKTVYNVPYQFDTCIELQEICKKYDLTFSDVVLQNEVSIKKEQDVYTYLRKIHKMMNDAIERGMRNHICI